MSAAEHDHPGLRVRVTPLRMNGVPWFEEQEKKIFEEISKIKHIFEKFLGYKITKKNFKKAIVDFVPLLTTRFADDSELADEERTALSDFFTICNPHLGDIIWANTKEKILNICQETGLFLRNKEA